MSVSCDCEGLAAEPVVTPNVSILSSTDILAVDQACIDLDNDGARISAFDAAQGLKPFVQD